MNKTIEALDPTELDAVFAEVAAETRWEAQQQLLADDLLFAGKGLPDEVWDASIDDAKAILASLNPVTFGSEQWSSRLLLQTLLLIRRGCNSIAEKQMQTNPDGGRDPDKYVHLMIPLRHRRLQRLLKQWAESLPWISKLLDPSEEEMATLAMAGLKSIGIDAYVIVRLRDLGEERRIG